MSYQKLTPGHQGQIVMMRKEGKTPQEVCDYFKAKYQIKIEPWKVSYICSKVKAGGVATDERPRRRAAQRKYAAKQSTKEPVVTDDNVIKDILQILGQIHDGYRQVFKHLRLELIKSRAQVHEMLQGAGVTDED